MKATLTITINIPDELAQTKEQRDRLARHFRKWSRGCSELLEPLLEDDNTISVTNHQLDAPWPVLGPLLSSARLKGKLMRVETTSLPEDEEPIPE